MTPFPCEIVDASPADAEAILALQKLAYASEARRYDDWTIPPLVETLDSVRQQIAQHVVLKAIVDGRLAGSVRGVVTDGVCEVCRLSVDPALQRRGIGSALLVAIERRFPGIDAFELFTGNRSVENLRLYERHGYRHAAPRCCRPRYRWCSSASRAARTPFDTGPHDLDRAVPLRAPRLGGPRLLQGGVRRRGTARDRGSGRGRRRPAVRRRRAVLDRDESPEHGNFSPETLKGGTVRMILTVADPDAAFARAVAAGATVVTPITEDYGWRVGRVVDPYGHHWEIGTR